MTRSKEYSPFHPELDQKYPVGSLGFHPDDIDSIMRGQVPPFNWVRLFNCSPANNSEAEILIGELLANSVRAGQWIDSPAPTQDKSMGDAIFESPESDFRLVIHGTPLQFLRAATILTDVRLVKKVTDEIGREYLSPTERLAEFIGQRVGFSRW